MADQNVKRVTAPFDDATARSLQAGDRVLITGTLLAARDAAHKRMVESLRDVPANHGRHGSE